MSDFECISLLYLDPSLIWHSLYFATVGSVIFTYHSIGLSSVPPFLHTIQWSIQHVVYVKKINLSDRLCRFYTTHGCVLWSPHAHGSCQWINCIWMTLHDHLDRFCHFCIPFNMSVSVPPFLCTIQWAYTACYAIVYHGLKCRHATWSEPWPEPRPQPWSHPWPEFRHATWPRRARHGVVSGWGSIGVGAVSARCRVRYIFSTVVSVLGETHEPRGAAVARDRPATRLLPAQTRLPLRTLLSWAAETTYYLYAVTVFSSCWSRCWLLSLPTLMLIAQAVFLVEHGQTDRQTDTH